MPQRIRFLVLPVLALAGLVISIVQISHFYDLRGGMSSFESYCKVGASFDCNAVDASKYAEVLPGLPLAGVAAAYFLALLMLTLWLHFGTRIKETLYISFYLSVAALLVSTIYLTVMHFELNTYCILCLAVDGINFTVFLILLSLRPWSAKGQLVKAQVKSVIVTAAVVFLVGTAVVRMANPLSTKQVEDVVQYVLNRPVLKITESDSYPSIGPQDAAVTIVKFSDFQCPACQRGAFSVHPILARFPNEVRFVFRHFPLDSNCNPGVKSKMHAFACEAARYAECAHKQGRFKELYEIVFQNQNELNSENLNRWSKQLDLNQDALKACLGSPETVLAISRDIDEGIKLGIESTPTFFVNGRRFPGAYPTEIWLELVERLLKAP